MAIRYCFKKFKQFSYYIKTDDDIYVNYPVLFSTLKYINKQNNSIYGHYSKKFKITRNRNIGSYIPYSQYPHEFCPEYVYGGFIIITYTALAKIFYATKHKRNYIWKEDVNLGIICKSCNISVLQLPYVDISLRNKNCVKNKKVIAVEIYSITDKLYCIR